MELRGEEKKIPILQLPYLENILGSKFPTKIQVFQHYMFLVKVIIKDIKILPQKTALNHGGRDDL